MSLSRQAIEEFKKIYYQEFGERISEQEAQEMEEGLLFLFELFLKPQPADKQQTDNSKPALPKPPMI
jgi:hypothetical protein